jgi:hypothetical protein
LPPGETGTVTVIQRANSDLRLNPHLHTIFLDGVYSQYQPEASLPSMVEMLLSCN